MAKKVPRVWTLIGDFIIDGPDLVGDEVVTVVEVLEGEENEK